MNQDNSLCTNLRSDWKTFAVINWKRASWHCPSPRVTHYWGLFKKSKLCMFLFILYFFYCPSLCCYSRVPFKEHSLRMQIMLRSLQQPYRGLSESRREGEEERLYSHSKHNMWGTERKGVDRRNGETDVEKRIQQMSGKNGNREKWKKSGGEIPTQTLTHHWNCSFTEEVAWRQSTDIVFVETQQH